MSKVSVKTPALPLEKVIVVPVSWKASARHRGVAGWVKSRPAGGPTLRVFPVTGMGKAPPIVGVDGLTTTELTLLELANLVSCTAVNEKFWLVSKLPEVGGPLNTLTV